eukprot:m.278896 g.278896  ORF g.278896 m.278896 type:complete len:85 (-) comp54893_c2_seq12:87-341(-)
MPIPTLGRLIFVALFALLHLRKEMYSYSLFDDDAWAYVFMLLFGMTNGYFGSLCMMYGPRYCYLTLSSRFSLCRLRSVCVSRCV